MSFQLSEEADGRILVVHVTGKLIKADYARFVPEFERRLNESGKQRVLFDMAEFHGWDAAAAWEDIKFDVKHFADIVRLAMVGEKKWHHVMAELFKPFTKAKTRYFDRSEAAAARKWLSES